MYKVKTLNKIAKIGLDRLPAERFSIDDKCDSPDAVLVRSASMHEIELPKSLLCIGRAGAGVNNIPVDECSKKGIVVFNAPGANANAVKELTICALLLASRDIIGGVAWARELVGDDVPAQVEKGKSAFVGPEIAGKTLGLVGLGAIGVGVANAARHLGMDIIGFDPFLSVDSAWKLHPNIRRARDINEIFAESDYISLHVPLSKDTKDILSGTFGKVKKGVRLINLSRGGLFDDAALIAALNDGTVARYVTDFPSAALVSHPGVVPIPHLGASTPESEDNCAVMVADQTRDYVLLGSIKNSVNLPDVELPYLEGYRLCVLHRNIPHMLSEISSALAGKGINIENMINKSKGDYAYTMLDVASLPGEPVLDGMRRIDGMLRVRLIKI